MSVPVFEVIRRWLPDGATRICLLAGTAVSEAALTVAADLGVDVVHQPDAEAVIDAGYDVLIVADDADPVSALSVVAAYTRRDASGVMPSVPSSNFPVLDDDAAWMALAGAVRDRLRTLRPHLAEFDVVLNGEGMTSIAAMQRSMTTAALRRVPVLFNGIGACAAAVVSDRISHPQSMNLLCADAIDHPAMAATLDRIGRPALATFEISDAHLGALLAVPIIRAAGLTG